MIKYDVPLDLDNNANMKELVKQIKPNSLVLEFGPSTGRLTSYLKNELNCQVYIVEIDKEAFEISKQYSTKAICDDIETYSWKEMAEGVVFDYVIFADVLEHLKRPERVIEELKQFINKDSRILVSVPNITHNAVVLQLLNQRFDYQKTGLLDNTHIHFFTKETIKEMFLNSGYHMVTYRGTVAEPYNTELKMNFDTIPQSVVDYLSSRDYGNLYQIICEFSLSDTLEQHNEITNSKSREYYAKLFFDYVGEGFSEENSMYCKIDLDNEIVNVTLNFDDEDGKYIHSIAMLPLHNYWSESSIKEVMINGVYYNDTYTLDGFCAQSKQKDNLIREQKYVFDIQSSVKSMSIQYYCKKIYLDEVYEELYKTCLNLNHKYKMVKYGGESKQDSEQIALLEKMSKEKVLQKSNIIQTLGGPKKLNAFSRASKTLYDVKIYNPNIYNQFVYYKNIFAFSSVEDKEALLTADYAIISFLKTDLTKHIYDYIARMTLDGLVYYFDSQVAGTVNCKTDFSVDYLMNNPCEFDVVLIATDLLKIISSDHLVDKVTNSREFMLLISKYTKDIKHIPQVLYNTCEYTHNVLSGTIIDDVLNYKYNGHASFEKGKVVYNFLQSKPKVSIIIPTKDGVNMLAPCVQSIIEKSSYSNFEILILNNNSEKDETFAWFDEVSRRYDNVRVIDALFEFNWSKLNNFGIKHATGDVFIFLNNDTLVKVNDWIEVLAGNALRPDVGVVGGLLLYEDETIQHAGVVIGMTDFADHIYKGETLECDEGCFPNPLQKRNVSAVTGACMAISRATIVKIGGFNEEFIICGSDVEICLRAYKMGLVNVYEPNAVLYHLESKTRDSYIPEIDFYLSAIHYEPFKSEGDPFYNNNLDYKKTTPKLKRERKML